ncbi:hypothetical protein FY036_17530 [Mesorhizobium microcysteis]|uniref:Uncharacterized protein n=1 Tax=Neoaquamicrobium microcysteis TaxID=2682781 RepID=A0A5D4GNW0_9HYPH|nr:hypothetical protein [Mesorhizobium microcysteis]TYR30516.1 hypothetical protein FY036_17530 [Mesorhizobium microcysteis]
MTGQTTLTPLIELATQKNLDLFFRVGQGYVTRSMRDGGQRAASFGASPIGVQSRAEARILCTLSPPLPEAKLYAWPGGPQRARQAGLTGRI